MTSPPVEELAETLVQLADTLVDEFDLDGFLRLLADRCIQLLGANSAGLLLVGDSGAITATGGSNETAMRLGLLEVRYGEGPTVDSCRGGDVVVVPDLTNVAPSRWPQFTTAALAAGFAAVHTIPMRLRTEVIGAISLFWTEPDEPDRAYARVARAMVDVATIGVLQQRTVRRKDEVAAQLQHALDSRVVIEQAKGVIAERFGLGMRAAFEALRDYARSHNERVSDLATSIVDGEFDTSGLLG